MTFSFLYLSLTRCFASKSMFKKFAVSSVVSSPADSEMKKGGKNAAVTFYDLKISDSSTISKVGELCE